jgi:hypothetical protein
MTTFHSWPRPSRPIFFAGEWRGTVPLDGVRLAPGPARVDVHRAWRRFTAPRVRYKVGHDGSVWRSRNPTPLYQFWFVKP